MDVSVSTSASTIRNIHSHTDTTLACPSQSHGLSQPSSPHSSSLPSPPDSPSGSISSLPSVSSSFFSSSVAASPPRSHTQSEHARESTQGLIIPSLTLPAALRRPTPYGKTLGDIRLIVVGGNDADASNLSGVLLDDNEDVVEVGEWEESQRSSFIRASTDWIEHSDAHGLEKFEASHNIELRKLPCYDQDDNSESILHDIVSLTHSRFSSMSAIINDKCPPSALLANLVASPTSPLHTALILLLSSASPSSLERNLIDDLALQIPVIVFPRPSEFHRYPLSSHLSSFRPTSFVALRSGLFRSPEILHTLRSEAADRFMRWREVERATEEVKLVSNTTILSSEEETIAHKSLWSKEKWDQQWDGSLSESVAKRLQEGRMTARGPTVGHRPLPCSISLVDPLHIPTLFICSLSLLEPVRQQLGGCFTGILDKLSDYQVQFAMLGSFCVGIGIGMLLK